MAGESHSASGPSPAGHEVNGPAATAAEHTQATGSSMPATESAAQTANDPEQVSENPASVDEAAHPVATAPTAPTAPTPNAPTAPTAPTTPTVADLSPAACAARLAELFPAVFAPGAPKPLKLRIQADIQQRAPGVFTRKSLSGFLHRHTTSTAYLRALAEAADRIDLDGLPAGPVNDEHRQAAAGELQRRRGLHEERRAAEREAQRKAFEERRAGEREAQRALQDKARRERAAEGQGLNERAVLLRAYETTTLTRANFCALKGLSEADLEAALVQARQERERFAQAPQSRERFAQAPRQNPPHERIAEREPRRPTQRPDAGPTERDPRAAHRKQPDRRPRGAPKPPR